MSLTFFDLQEQARRRSQWATFFFYLTLLSLLAWLGTDTREQAEACIQTARQHLLGYSGGITLSLQSRDSCSLQQLHHTCQTLSRLTPGIQKRLISAALAAAAVNGEMRENEFLAVRAAAAAMNVPVQPTIRISS